MLRCAFFLFLTLFSATLATADPSGVIRVIDGDTFDVGGERVRLHGIDAVEVGQTCRSAQGVRWDCGTSVQDEVRARYQGQRATCKTRDVDRYGRIVAKCFVAGRDVGAELVADGLALAYVKYSRDYVTLEKSASVQNRGLWSSTYERPAVARQQASRGRDAPDPNCAIKGNISKNGRIYHMPGDRFYARTGINENRGERWFCSASEAQRAGWRRAGQ